MMQKEKKRVPKLRFDGFEGEWEKKELDSKIKLISGYAFKGDDISEDSNGTPLMRGINITEGRIRHSETIDRYYLGDASKLERFKLKEGDIVLGMDGSKVGKNVAIISKEDSDSLLIQRVARIRGKKGTDTSFIYLNIFNPTFHRYVDVVNTSSGIPHISAKQIKEYKIGFPCLSEQQKIASFLTSIDTRIQQLEKKKTLLEQYKKGVMQKVFSQEIRFRRDDGEEFGEWEEKMLEDLNFFISDGNYGELYPKANEMKSSGIPFIRANNIKGLTLTWKDMRYIAPEHHEVLKSGHLRTNDILVTTRGDIGMVAIVNEEFNNANINAQICLLRCPEQLNSHYILQYLGSSFGLRQFKRIQTGSALKQLPKGNLNKVIIPVPCLEEQTKIAHFLSAIDRKIAVVDEQIEGMKEWKKGVMERMFV